MLDKVLAFWGSHGTKVLAFVQGTIAVVAGVTGIIPDAHMKWYLLAGALLTFWRGFVNTSNQPAQ